MWKRSQIKEGVDYVVQLCQGQDRIRDLRLREVNGGKGDPGMVFETGIAPYEVLWKGSIIEMSSKLRLTNGAEFRHEAHGIWLTVEEYEAILSHSEIPWCTEEPPSFPPK